MHTELSNQSRNRLRSVRLRLRFCSVLFCSFGSVQSFLHRPKPTDIFDKKKQKRKKRPSHFHFRFTNTTAVVRSSSRNSSSKAGLRATIRTGILGYLLSIDGGRSRPTNQRTTRQQAHTTTPPPKIFPRCLSSRQSWKGAKNKKTKTKENAEQCVYTWKGLDGIFPTPCPLCVMTHQPTHPYCRKIAPEGVCLRCYLVSPREGIGPFSIRYQHDTAVLLFLPNVVYGN